MNDNCPVCGGVLDRNFTENEIKATGKDVICICTRTIWVPLDPNEKPSLIPSTETKALLCS